jgi:hypothetical protein
MKFGGKKKMSEAVLRYLEYHSTPSVNYENQYPKFLWPQDAFTQPDLVSTEDDQAQELIHQIRYSFVANQEILADKLIKLFNFAKEESQASPGISIKSLSSFYDFLILHENIKIPNLSLTPDHNIYASWRAENRLFSAHFLPDGNIRFVLFIPNNRHPNQKIRMSGTVTGDTLMEVVASESLIDWVISEG